MPGTTIRLTRRWTTLDGKQFQSRVDAEKHTRTLTAEPLIKAFESETLLILIGELDGGGDAFRLSAPSDASSAHTG